MSLTGLFKSNSKCPLCGANKNIFDLQQTKQGLFKTKITTIYMCSNCGYRWEEDK